jgi:hypothetical protein
MGRRSRARAREAAPSAPATARRGPGESPGWRLLHRLNPIKTPPSRTRVRLAAVVFGAGAAVLALVGWATGSSAWFNPAVSLAVLAVVWAVFALTMRGEDRSS